MHRVNTGLRVVLCVVVLSPIAAYGRDDSPVSVAVMEFGTRGADPDLVRTFADAVAAELGKRPGREVRSDAELKSMLNFEASRQLLGCTGDGCYSEIGKLLDVDQLVAGTVAKLGRGHFVSLSLIDAYDGQVKSRTAFKVAGGADALVASAKGAVGELLEVPATVHIAGQIDGGRVFIDGALAGVMPLQRLLRRENETVELRVEHPDYPTYTQPLSLVPGNETWVRLQMLSYHERAELSDSRTITGAVLGFVGAGLLAGGGFFALQGSGYKRDYDQVDPRSVTQVQLDEMGDAARWRLQVGNVGFVAGGALVAGALYLLLHDPYAIDLDLQGGGGGLQIRF